MIELCRGILYNSIAFSYEFYGFLINFRCSVTLQSLGQCGTQYIMTPRHWETPFDLPIDLWPWGKWWNCQLESFFLYIRLFYWVWNSKLWSKSGFLHCCTVLNFLFLPQWLSFIFNISFWKNPMHLIFLENIFTHSSKESNFISVCICRILKLTAPFHGKFGLNWTFCDQG